MTGRSHTAARLLTLALLAGCSQHTTSMPQSGTPPGKTITLGATRLDPDDLTMSHDETLSFVSTADHPMTIEFTQPKDQAGRIKCRVADPKLLKGGQAPWATFRMNSEGHLTADVPGGLFPSVCSLAPGSYTYIVKMMDPGLREAPGRLGQQGTITVK
jgi:hypothetical protein